MSLYAPIQCVECGAVPSLESNGEVGSVRAACKCATLSTTTDGFTLGDVPWTWERVTDDD